MNLAKRILQGEQLTKETVLKIMRILILIP